MQTEVVKSWEMFHLQVFWQSAPLLYSSVASQQSEEKIQMLKYKFYNMAEKLQSKLIQIHTTDSIIDAGRGDECWSETGIGTVEVAMGTSSSTWNIKSFQSVKKENIVVSHWYWLNIWKGQHHWNLHHWGHTDLAHQTHPDNHSSHHLFGQREWCGIHPNK